MNYFWSSSFQYKIAHCHILYTTWKFVRLSNIIDPPTHWFTEQCHNIFCASQIYYVLEIKDVALLNNNVYLLIFISFLQNDVLLKIHQFWIWQIQKRWYMMIYHHITLSALNNLRWNTGGRSYIAIAQHGAKFITQYLPELLPLLLQP